MQAKLLRVLETGDVMRVGSSESRRVDVRVIAASNRVLDRGVREGRFRADLF
jgi:transcriptional regulator with PAS, ATPase and Fis domain